MKAAIAHILVTSLLEPEENISFTVVYNLITYYINQPYMARYLRTQIHYSQKVRVLPVYNILHQPAIYDKMSENTNTLLTIS
jgi:hypothetical protein